MKKLISTIFALVLVAVLLAACGTATPAPATSAPATSAPGETAAPPATAAPTVGSNVTLTYISSQGWVLDAELALGKKFEEQTGIKIDYQIIPSDQYFNVLKTKLASGEGPDIFGGQSGVTDLQVNYDVAKNAVDLSGEPWTKTEDPLVLAQASLDGKVYGVTVWGSTPWVINYNKDIFAKLNLSVPTNYAEFKDICQKIKASGVLPIYEPAADGWPQTLWFPELGPRYEQVTPGLADQLNANQATFADNATMLTVLTQLNEMYQLGFFGANALADTFADGTKVMSSGTAAMFLGNLIYAQQIKGDYPDFNIDTIGVFVMPLADNQLLNLNPASPTKFIYSGSKHIAEAKQYFNFLTQLENLQYFIDNSTAVQDLPFPGLKSKFLPSQQAFMDAHSAPGTRGTVYQTAVKYVNPQWMDIGKDIVAMWTGVETPHDVLVNIDKRRAEEAKAAKDPAWK